MLCILNHIAYVFKTGIFASYSSKSCIYAIEAIYGIICGNGEEMKEKVVVLRELHRAIIYTTEMSKQVK
jgi:hypothetical protein